ncbi:hypothetical protein DA11_03770, partial [Aeromonas caviae]
MLQGDDCLGAVLDPKFAEGGVIWALMVARVQLSLISICWRAMTAWVGVFDPKFAEGGVIWALMVARGSTVL